MLKALFTWFGLFLCTLGYSWSAKNPALAEARLALDEETSPSFLAQVTSDGTVNTEVNTDGNTAEITGGETRGNNLFHSFQDFSVETGNEASFDNADRISNIFSRVTGGNISNIDGSISANGSANLFLINPAGIVFGEGARLDIGGSFYGSSASSILFEDGEFSAVDLENPPLLTVNAPIGLGFRDQPGYIVNRSVVQNSNQEIVGLEVSQGDRLAFIGGNINFEGGQATARGGNIELGGLSTAGIVGINTDGSLSFPDNLVKADITLSKDADVDTRGTGGGSIRVNAQNLTLEAGEIKDVVTASLPAGIRAGITADSTSTEAQGGNITLDIAEKITLDGSGITNQVDRGGIGNTGNITINTGSLEAINGGRINVSTSGEGDAGSVNITATGSMIAAGTNSKGIPSGVSNSIDIGAKGNTEGIKISTTNLNLTDGSSIETNIIGKGDTGIIDIIATGDIALTGGSLNGAGSRITSQVVAAGRDIGDIEGIKTDGVGDAGGIKISTTNLNLTDGGNINASTFGRGNAGKIEITATGDITAARKTSQSTYSGVFSEVFTDLLGNGGEIKISTTNLNLIDGGSIKTTTAGQGNAGEINIIATGDITATGVGSQGFESSISSQVNRNIDMEGTETLGVGDAGRIKISATNLNLIDGGIISASTSGQGDAGVLTINADNIFLDGTDSNGFSSAILSNVGKTGVGSAGDISISTEELSLTNGGQITASTFGQGDAGTLTINADNIFLDGISSNGFSSGIFSTVEKTGVGSAGGISISTGELSLTNGGEISASTLGQGDAGTLTINADNIFLDGIGSNGFYSGIFSRVGKTGVGSAGGISISARELSLTNGGRISVDSTGKGNAGKLFVEAKSLSLNSALIIASTGFEQGGVIDLQIAKNITLENNSGIVALAFNDANGGNLNIDTNFIIAYANSVSGNDLVASADTGNGGNIDLTVERLFGLEQGKSTDNTANAIKNNRNDIDASSNVFGLDGTVNINTSTTVDPIQGITELPINLVEAKQSTEQTCSANREGKANNGLAIAGKGGITPAPDTPLNSENIMSSDRSHATNNIPQAIETSQGKIQPARGVRVTESGKIVLTAYHTNNAGERIPEIKPNCNSN